MPDKKTLYEGRVFSLVREQVTLPNGREAQLDIIEHPGAAAILPVSEDRALLLLKQYRHAAGGFIWEIPAGTLDPGESPEECAHRELIEETGHKAGNLEKLASVTPVPGYSTEVIHIYLATDLSPASQNLDPDEVLSVHRLSPKEVREMLWKNEITDAKTLLAIHLAGDRLFTSG